MARPYKDLEPIDSKHLCLFPDELACVINTVMAGNATICTFVNRVATPEVVDLYPKVPEKDCARTRREGNCPRGISKDE